MKVWDLGVWDLGLFCQFNKSYTRSYIIVHRQVWGLGI